MFFFFGKGNKINGMVLQVIGCQIFFPKLHGYFPKDNAYS
jgi:hypothetical protein